jgi:hypothetical protein
MPDACQFEGKVNDKKIILTWTYTDTSVGAEGSYGLKDSSIYGFCIIQNLEGGHFALRCSASKDGEPTAYYVTQQANTYPSPYVCKTGCNSDIVQTFFEECEVEGD